MRFHTLATIGLVAFVSSQSRAQTNELASVSLGTQVTAGGTANDVAVITPRIGTALNQPGSIGNNLAGIQYVAGNVPLTGAPTSISFYALTGAAIPGGAANPATDFTSYATLTSPTGVVTYLDVASKLTPSSYSGMTFAAADLGFGAGNFYSIHHAPSNVDYLAEIVPGTGTSSSIADLKPMSWAGPTAGTPASPGSNGYFALTWATGILSAGAPYADQSLYYLRTDSLGHTQFGVMIPALTGASSDTLDLTTAVGSYGATGYTTLAFTPSVLGDIPASQFYYLRLDPITGNTILGRLNPSLTAGTRTISDIANLGGVFNTLNFAPDATGPAAAWGSAQFYATGSLAAGAQSISFEAIPNHNVGDVFTVTPTASSGLDIDVTVVSGPATIQTTGISGATPTSLRVFTVTTTGPGIVTLQARQAGQLAAPAFTANLLQQSFDVTGSYPATVGMPFPTYTIGATGSPTSYSATGLPPGLTLNALTGAIDGTPSAAGTYVVPIAATNTAGTGTADLTITVAAAGAAPTITSAATAPGTVGTAIDYTVEATGSPTSYTATGLPPGLTLNSLTGAITGTPTAPGTYVVTVTATNSIGTSTTTVTFAIAGAGTPPVITGPSTTSGSVGTAVTVTIGATGSGTSYTATGLPPGLTLNPLTGAIGGIPTTAGTYVATVTATNSSGTSTTNLTWVIAPVGFSHIVNFSARAFSGAGSDTLIVGFVVLGDGKNLLIRGIGPDLSSFGITDFLPAPILTLFSASGAVLATDSGWGVNSSGQNDGALIASTASSVGAFALPSGSLDSALLVTLNNGAHTTGLLTTNGAAGVGLIEIYDTGGNPNASLINVSARMNVTAGSGVLIRGLGYRRQRTKDRAHTRNRTHPVGIRRFRHPTRPPDHRILRIHTDCEQCELEQRGRRQLSCAGEQHLSPSGGVPAGGGQQGRRSPSPRSSPVPTRSR